MTEPVAAADLARLEELLAAGTPGPWTTGDYHGDVGIFPPPWVAALPGIVFRRRRSPIGVTNGLAEDAADATLAVAAVNALPDLIARLRRAEKALREVIEEWDKRDEWDDRDLELVAETHAALSGDAQP